MNGELGAIREVEVNALIEKSRTFAGGGTPSCPTIKQAILMLCLALQAQGAEAVSEEKCAAAEFTEVREFPILWLLVIISWLAVFLMGCMVGCKWSPKARHKDEGHSTEGHTLCDDSQSVTIKSDNHQKSDPVLWQGGRLMYHLDTDDRVVHLSRECRHLKGVRAVERRLRRRRLCLTCAAAMSPQQDAPRKEP